MPSILKFISVLGFFVLTVLGLQPWVSTGQILPGLPALLAGLGVLSGVWFALAHQAKKLQTSRQRLHLLFQVLGFACFMLGLLGISQIGFDSFGLGMVFGRFLLLGLVFVVLSIAV
jgi:hypothetical protein